MHSRQPNKVSSCCCCRLDYRTRHNERTNIEILAHSAARADVMECLVFFFPLFISYPPPHPNFFLTSPHRSPARPSLTLFPLPHPPLPTQPRPISSPSAPLHGTASKQMYHQQSTAESRSTALLIGILLYTCSTRCTLHVTSLRYHAGHSLD
jgi:hypothetical protein